MTLRLDNARSYGCESGLESLDVDVLLCHVLQRPRSYLYAWPEKILTREQWQTFQSYCHRRLTGEPIAYITGRREFWSLPLQTAPHTLIPRPDTEVLVETVLETCAQAEQVCLDLGTGTGAIALALKSERPGWIIRGVDRIPEAVQLAQANARALGLDVLFYQGSWCESVAEQSLDIIVSNPPYIDVDDHHLQEGDVRFEPSSALVSGGNGLADIDAIIGQGRRCLKAGGGLFFEHGWQQAEAVRQRLMSQGYVDVMTRKDYAGQDRVTFGRLHG